ncbi:MAG: hypothetical protein GX931_04105 [Acholeplasmataceae bacterium]|nr:hypothetical protein [Acholeplasmataceae bacterium]
MEKINFERSIVVKKKTYTLRELVDKLSSLSSEVVKDFFGLIGLTVPRKIRMHALRETLKETVYKTIEERESLADELGYRLSWFKRYSEYQLENLLKYFNDEKLNKEYLERLWVLLIDYLLDKKVSEDEFINFINKKVKNEDDIHTYNEKINPIFFDEPNEIDGLHPNIFRPVLYKSSTLVEIREIGRKYGVNVPRRLKKNELADIIVDELRERGEHTPELETHLRGLSIIMMQRFAKDRDIKASTELKKEEIIEYILANAQETKEAYYLPSDSSIYEQELNEPVKKAEVVEEVIEEVVEEVVEEPQETLTSAEQELLLEEIKKLNEEVVRLQDQLKELKEGREFLDEEFEEEPFVHYHEHHHYHHYDEEDSSLIKKEDPQEIVEDPEEESQDVLVTPEEKNRKPLVLILNVLIVLAVVILTVILLMIHKVI